MEPNDPKLRELLREWQTPAMPADLDQRVLVQRAPLWRFFRASIRIPVPVACMLTFVLLTAGWWLARQTEPQAPCVTAAARLCTALPICRT
ncbi:MAG TPA: hypothetical protein VGN17_08970 [Bryobacteraceae bacterium]|jgi:hypothetical protein